MRNHHTVAINTVSDVVTVSVITVLLHYDYCLLHIYFCRIFQQEFNF